MHRWADKPSSLPARSLQNASHGQTAARDAASAWNPLPLHKNIRGAAMQHDFFLLFNALSQSVKSDGQQKHNTHAYLLPVRIYIQDRKSVIQH